MHFVERSFVCSRLKIGEWSSYRLVRPTRLSLIGTDKVIALLNSSRRARQEETECIPSDIITAEEAEVMFGISATRLVKWTRRSVNVPPHYRLTKHITRFRTSSLSKWLERMSK